MSRLVPDGDQLDALSYMLRPGAEGGALVASDVGTGKTLIGAEFCIRSGAKSVLVLGPTADVLTSWAETFERQSWEHGVYRIDSTPAGRAASTRFQWRAPGLYLTTHALFERRAWDRVPDIDPKTGKQKVDKKTGKLLFKKVDSGTWSEAVDVLLFDEVHQASNWQSYTHKALMNTNPKFRIGLSGTYEGGGFDGAYAVGKWIWPHRAAKNIYQWRFQWAETVFDAFAPQNQRTVGEKIPGAFVAQLPCYVRIESELPEPNFIDVTYQLYPEQRRVLDELDKKMIAWIDDNPLITKMPITKRTRMRQATLAVPTLTFDDDGELIDVSFSDDADSAGLDLLLEMLDRGEMPGQVLIMCSSTRFAKIVTTRLNARYGADSAREWSGTVTRAEREKVKAAFIARQIRFIVGQPAAMGTGTDGLQLVCHTTVRLGLRDRRLDNEQAVGRTNRRGQPVLPVTVYTLLADGTIDAGHMNKQIEDTLAQRRRMRNRGKAT